MEFGMKLGMRGGGVGKAIGGQDAKGEGEAPAVVVSYIN